MVYSKGINEIQLSITKGSYMLTLSNITKDYVSGDTSVRALENVSVCFRKNEFVSILGHSGCGKTTLLNIIGGLDRYTSGDLRIKGVSTARYKDADWDAYRNHSIGFVFQSYNLIPHQTVLSNVELSLTLSGVTKSERKKRAEEVLKKVGLADQMHKKPSQMSGGQMQRVAIARALINDPEILLADEPTGALDTETSIQIMEILREISKDKLIIMVTHNPELAERYSDRIIRLKDGHVVDDTAPFSPMEELKELSEASKSQEAETDNTVRTKRRPSMSFLTALSLSLNNLMTKKARTILTSFAGSIGIIGIALILSLSNGINAYIARIQRETLSSYPIVLNKEEADISALISTFMGGSKKPDNPEPNTVYMSTVSYDLIKNMLNPQVNTNNLKKFMEFIENGNSDIKNLSQIIRYGYGVEINAYLSDDKNNYYKSDMQELFKNMATGMGLSESNASMMSGSMATYNVWEEMLPPSEGSDKLMHEMIEEQYQLVAGKWPTAKNEIVVLVSSDNMISDISLYSLGLISSDEMLSLAIGAMNGQEMDPDIKTSYTYEELLGISYRIIPSSDYYIKKNGQWTDLRTSGTKTELSGVIANGLELNVVGVIQQKPDSASGALSGTLIYTSALTDYLIEQTENSEIVKEQLADLTKDVFTGLPFSSGNESSLTDQQKASAFVSYLSTAGKAEKAEIYKSILTTPDENQVISQTELYLSGMGVTPDSTREELMNIVIQYAGEGNEDLANIYFETFTRDQLYQYIYDFALDAVRENFSSEAGKYVDEIICTPSETELDAEKSIVALYMVYAVNPDSVRSIASELVSKEGGSFNIDIENLSNAEILGLISSVLSAYGKSAGNCENYYQVIDNHIQNNFRKTYIISRYSEITDLPPDVISSEVNGMTEERVSAIFDSMLTSEALSTYATQNAGSQSEDSKNSKLAEAFDLALESGVYDSKLSEFYDKYVPVESPTTLQENYDLLGIIDKNDPSSISIYAGSFEEKEMISDIIDEYNASQTDEADVISYTDYFGLIMSSVTTIINAITYVLIAFVSISLIVSSIMIGIITYISVLERTKEIGILRALGASKRDISRVFNAETLIIGFASGFIGILVTVLLNIPISIIISILSGISGLSALPVVGGVILVVISMLLTLIAGLIPSKLAAKKDPVEALRTE